MSEWGKNVEEAATVFGGIAALFKMLPTARRPRELQFLDPATDKGLTDHKVFVNDRAVARTDGSGKVRVTLRGLTDVQLVNTASGSRCELRLSQEDGWGYSVMVDPNRLYKGETLRVFVRVFHA